MATLLFRWLLRLYPANWRAEFGAEMLDVFQEAHAASRHKLWFCLREFAGLAAGAALASPEPWLRSLEAPLLVFVLYRLGFHIGRDLRVHGLLFFPGSYLLIAALCGIAAWIVGRNCTLLQPRRLLLTVAVAVACLLAIPFAVKATERAWIEHLLNTSGSSHYRLPGVSVTIESHDRLPLPPGAHWTEFIQRKGTNWTEIIQRNTDGRCLSILHNTTQDTPPYGWIAGFLFMAVALYARRTIENRSA